MQIGALSAPPCRDARPARSSYRSWALAAGSPWLAPMKVDSGQALGSSTKLATKYRIIIEPPYNVRSKRKTSSETGNSFQASVFQSLLRGRRQANPVRLMPVRNKRSWFNARTGAGLRSPLRGAQMDSWFVPPIVVPIMLVVLILGFCAVPRCFVSALPFDGVRLLKEDQEIRSVCVEHGPSASRSLCRQQ